MSKQEFWKLLTHDFRPPIQGGEPLWDGKTLPFKLEKIKVDKTDNECAAGWNFVDDIATGFKIVGMWPTGRPSVVVKVNPSRDKINRGNKWRCSELIIERLATEQEIETAIERFSKVFGSHANEMAKEQILWRQALGRPLADINKVTNGLEAALSGRGLKWKLEEFDSSRAAWASRPAWDVRVAWDAWSVRASRSAWAAWDTWATWAAWDAWSVRASRSVRAAWDAWATWAAWDALTIQFASRQKWISHAPDLFTVGIRDAYLNGLEVAIPVAKDTLGFSIKP